MKMRRLLTAFLVAMIALPVSLGFAAKKNAPLKVGDKGWKVKTVQTKLNTLGLKTPLTGKYSRDLEKQVRIFQKTHKLPVTGKVDDKTYFRINEAAFEKEGIHGVKGKDVVRTASKYKGVPYSFGGTTPRAFDCSGFVQYVFKKHKADLPRTADLQYEKGLFVTMRQLKPGDLVFFQGTYDTSGASHVGIYVGNGMMIHCGNPISYASIESNYWQQHFYCFGRIRN